MGPHLFSEIVVNRFCNTLEEQVYIFIEEDAGLWSEYQELLKKNDPYEIKEIINESFVKAIINHKPILYSYAKKNQRIESFIENLSNKFIANILDCVFLFIERTPELMKYFYINPDSIVEVQYNIREIIIERLYLISTGYEEDNPRSNLLNQYIEMMLKAEEE